MFGATGTSYTTVNTYLSCGLDNESATCNPIFGDNRYNSTIASGYHNYKA